MSYKSYVPRTDAKLFEWAQNLFEYATKNFNNWKIPAPSGDMSDNAETFERRLQQTSSPNRGKIDTLQKNEARKELVKSFRTYVQGFLAKNPNVTNVDREKMRLTVYDIIPTAVGNPVGLVTATVKYPNEGALELSIKHVEGTPFDARANYGVKIKYDVFAADTPLATNERELQESRFTRKKKELFTFDRNDRQKTACFCLRYENSKGNAGQWGAIVSAIIP
jgi:hypothetical protein